MSIPLLPFAERQRDIVMAGTSEKLAYLVKERKTLIVIAIRITITMAFWARANVIKRTDLRPIFRCVELMERMSLPPKIISKGY